MESIQNQKENKQKWKKSMQKSNKRSFVGVIFIIVGTVLIASKMGLMPDNIRHIVISWPMLLIGIGGLNIFANKNYSSGLILMAIGTFFMLPKIVDIPFEMREMFWPAIFVVIGVLMIFVKNRHRPLGANENSDNYIDLLNFFGGGKRKITSANFSGGKITSIFGGGELDLTAADIQEGQPTVDVFTLFGGTKLLVPADWDVQVDVISIFGGFDDKRGAVRVPENGNQRVLKIKGMAIFGGGEVKSY